MKAKLVTIVRAVKEGSSETTPTGQLQLWFWCTGCQAAHAVNTQLAPDQKAPLWTWDGNLDAPTIQPSVKCDYGQDPKDHKPRICHFFLRNGVIEYLGDCTHGAANQHVPLVDLPDWLVD